MQGSSVPCRCGSSIMMAMAEDLGAFTVGTVVLQSGVQRRLRVTTAWRLFAVRLRSHVIRDGVFEQVGSR